MNFYWMPLVAHLSMPSPTDSWGREHQDLSGVKAIGVDEIAWQRGHRYLTLVYQIDEHCKRLLWVGEKRTVKTLLRFFRWFGKARHHVLTCPTSKAWVTLRGWNPGAEP